MSKTNGWTEERRKRQSEAIRQWQPWKNSTGPKSDEGKTKIADNALKHGMRSREGEELSHILNQQKMFLAMLRDIINE
ncbi:MAG: hypothetical protein OEY94_08285 [Alphaproteobacteria bacterium]|nr:hypothetical protein [Alphaproteobacteria bacterium]